LIENFGTCGTVVTAEVSKRSDGRSAGFGTVLFETKEAAEHAISQFNHGEFDGRPMVVKIDAKVRSNASTYPLSWDCAKPKADRADPPAWWTG
jgi:RNA recognition motif-containing protein